MKSVNPYLCFNGNTEEAFDFYKSVFGGEFAGVVRFKDMKDTMGVTGENLNKIANIALPLGKNAFLMGDDGPAVFGQTVPKEQYFSINLETESLAETEQLFHALAAGGQVTMPLEPTEWAERFGMCTDKFGTKWSLNYTGNSTFSAK